MSVYPTFLLRILNASSDLLVLTSLADRKQARGAQRSLASPCVPPEY